MCNIIKYTLPYNTSTDTFVINFVQNFAGLLKLWHLVSFTDKEFVLLCSV